MHQQIIFSILGALNRGVLLVLAIARVLGRQDTEEACHCSPGLKSKNILVKSDLTCCINDYGLTIKFSNRGDPIKAQGQVQ